MTSTSGRVTHTTGLRAKQNRPFGRWRVLRKIGCEDQEADGLTDTTLNEPPERAFVEEEDAISLKDGYDTEDGNQRDFTLRGVIMADFRNDITGQQAGDQSEECWYKVAERNGIFYEEQKPGKQVDFCNGKGDDERKHN